MEIQGKYHCYIHVYTLELLDGNYVACAAFFPSETIIFKRLPNTTEIGHSLKPLNF